ncbi:MAG: hypothetical protein JWM11_1443 [Planctomycetaceae bacterium]|nr:hypothetical protein [Planctomycetaceae bacterium]
MHVVGCWAGIEGSGCKNVVGSQIRSEKPSGCCPTLAGKFLLGERNFVRCCQLRPTGPI